MNIETEDSPLVFAKTSGNNDSIEGSKVSYFFTQPGHALILDKKDTLLAEIDACERSLKYATDRIEEQAIEKEPSELRMALNLMS